MRILVRKKKKKARVLSPSLKKKKKKLPQKKFLIFPEMELSSSNIKKILIFSQKTAVLMFQEKGTP